MRAPLVIAEIYGAPPETRLLRAALRVGESRFIAEFQGNPLRLELRLREGTRGEVGMEVEAIDEEGRAFASGAASATVESDGQTLVRVDLQPRLQLAGSRAVHVQIAGEGRVVSEPPGIDCGEHCTKSFLLGTRLRLHGVSRAGVRIAGWTGSCTDDPCDIELWNVSGDGPVEVKASFAPTMCMASGWCWDNPWPQGNQLNALSFTPDGKGWFVGSFGTILRWDGTALSLWPSSTDKNLLGVWAGPGVAYAVGDGGTLLRFDGGKWAKLSGLPEKRFYAVIGIGTEEAWALGDGVWHLSGGNFQRVADHKGYGGTALWASSRDDIWAAGASGSILHFNGSAWTETRGGTNEAIVSLWGSGSGDIWAVGNEPAFGDDREPVVLRTKGGIWNREPLSRDQLRYLKHVWGTGPDNIWICGGEGGLRWNGATFEPLPGVCPIGGAGRGDLWSVSGSSIFRSRKGLAWQDLTRSTPVLGPFPRFMRLWGGGPEDIWAGLLHFSGATWVAELPPRELKVGIHSTWGSDQNDLWGAGSTGSTGTIVRRKAGKWISMPVPADAKELLNLHGSAPNNVWAVGRDGEVLRSQEVGFVRVPSPTKLTLLSVFVISPANVWIVPEEPAKLLHWDGERLSQKDIGVDQRMNSVWASGPSDVWAVGGFGGIVHWDGTAFRQVPMEPRTTVNTVFGSGREDVWVSGDTTVGGDGGLYRLRGGRFVKTAPITAGPIQLWGSPGGPFVAVTGSGLLRREDAP